MTTQNDTSEREERELHNLLFGVRRSIRYHNRRRRFLDNLGKTSSAIKLVGSSAAAVSVLAKFGSKWTPAFSLVVAALSAIDLIFQPAQSARLHSELARRFILLEQEIVLLAKISSENLRVFIGKRLEIEADEPPILRVLDSMCHNELLRAQGYSQKFFVPIRWWQRAFAQFFDIFESQIHPDKNGG